jgi:hypothetical protein
VRGRYKGIPWRCSVGGASISFSSRIAWEYLALHIALLPALRRLLLDRGIGMVGAAAFELDGEATVLAGLTGSGKTSLLLAALERGAAFAGDEYVGIGESGEVTPIIRSIALRQDTFALAPSLAPRLSARTRIALQSAALARRLTLRRLDPLVHLRPEELRVPSAGEGALPLRRLNWIEPGPGSARVEPLPASDVIERIAIMQAMHDRAYGDLGAQFDAARGCDRDDAAARRAVLERGLADVACFRVVVPEGAAPPREVVDLVLKAQ